MIIGREQWGAKHGDGKPGAVSPATEVWLHHSATIGPDLVAPFDDDYAAVRRLEEIGASRFGEVYGLSYTFVVTPAGLIFAGHHPNKLGAHTAGHNTRGRAICLAGNYSNQGVTPAQADAVVWLLRHGVDRGWWTEPRLTGGHRDTKATACPGQYAYDTIGELNRRAAAGPQLPPLVESLATRAGRLPSLAYGQRSEDVAHLQRFLARVFPSYAGHLPDTGFFGDQTRAVVREFQRRVGITGLGSDGSAVGPKTNAALAGFGYRARA